MRVTARASNGRGTRRGDRLGFESIRDGTNRSLRTALWSRKNRGPQGVLKRKPGLGPVSRKGYFRSFSFLVSAW